MNRNHQALSTGAFALILAAGLLFTLGCPSSQTSSDVMAKVNGHKIQRAEVDKGGSARAQGLMMAVQVSSGPILAKQPGWDTRR